MSEEKEFYLRRAKSRLKWLRSVKFFQGRDLIKSELNEIELLKDQIKRLSKELI